MIKVTKFFNLLKKSFLQVSSSASKTDMTSLEADLAVVEELMSRGDNPDLPREIIHYIYFKKSEDREMFLPKLTQAGFEIDTLDKVDIGYSVLCSKIQPLTEIYETTTWLEENAIHCNGEYDGWESPVTEPEEK